MILGDAQNELAMRQSSQSARHRDSLGSVKAASISLDPQNDATTILSILKMQDVGFSIDMY